VVLLVEDDVNFARILLDMARKQGFKALVALTGDTALARQFRPDAVSLDIQLPDMDGWQILDRLKHDPDLRHIPVHIITSVDENLDRGVKQGAIACIRKPVDQDQLSEVFANMEQFLDRKVKELLIVEDDEDQRKAMTELIGNSDVHTTAVGTGEQALAALADAPFECMVLDLGLPDMSGFDLIEKIHKDLGLTQLPIIVYTGKELTHQEETRLKAVTETIIVKDVKSPERLLDETALFLHRVQANLPKEKQKMIKQVHETDPALAGRKVLIVDDDVRNIFALTTVLERHKMEVVYAESGKEGIEKLRNTPDIGIVLMDIMMPDMDGYEAIGTIRRDAKFKRLPIISLTAKAMKGDREKCIAAGASNYISKPVDTEQLLSLLRVWLYK
jgi:CheY-like chemotaxis protein